MSFEYDVVYSDRRTIAVTVERNRRIVVRAPKQARPDAVAAAVERKRFWIWSKVRDAGKYAQRRPRKEFVAGETFLYLGQSFGLRLVSEPRGEVRFDRDRFELSRDDVSRARALFVAWYRATARAHLNPRVEAMASSMGIVVSQMDIQEMKGHWGSCSPGGRLIFNWRIVQAPVGVVDYLIAHELAHLIEPKHTPEFWNIVAVHTPGWEKARRWLLHHGGRLEW